MARDSGEPGGLPRRDRQDSGTHKEFRREEDSVAEYMDIME
jgi:hypothetical protein